MIYLSLLLIISLALNAVLIWYAKKVLVQIYRASQSASEIFTKFDIYKEHLKSIYELEMFYGDKNLKEVIEHTNELINFLKKYDNITDFTQPELEAILEEENITENNDGTTPQNLQEVFYKSSRTSNS